MSNKNKVLVQRRTTPIQLTGGDQLHAIYTDTEGRRYTHSFPVERALVVDKMVVFAVEDDLGLVSGYGLAIGEGSAEV